MSNNWDSSYLNGIKNTFKRMDSKDNGGNGDGKVNISEAQNDLNVGNLLSGMDENSEEYKNLESLTNTVPDALEKYAGDDGEFSATEWADFLNGEEWGTVLDAYHKSSGRSKTEMAWIDGSEGAINDGVVTSDEVKSGITNNTFRNAFANKASIGMIINAFFDTLSAREIVSKYAGDDGEFTTEEYTQLKNDKQYNMYMYKYGSMPWGVESDN